MKKKVICAAMAAMMIGAMAANVYADTARLSDGRPAEVFAYNDAENSGGEDVMVISAAPENYKIVINGKTLDLKGQKLFTENDTKGNKVLMVPLRAISEALGFKVEWNNGSVFVDDGSMHTTVTIGRDSYVAVTSIKDADGMTAPFSLGAAPKIVENRTYVPLQLFEILMGNVDGMFKLDGTTVNITTDGSGGNTQIPNPFVEYKTVEEASAASGIQFKVPSNIPAGYSLEYVSAIKGEMIQASYISSDKSSDILFRKGTGSEDISGVYSEYSQISTEKVGNVNVTLKGSNGKVNVATWTDGGYTYAIDINTDGAGLEKSAAADLVKNLI